MVKQPWEVKLKYAFVVGFSLLVAGCAAQRPTDPAAVVSGVKLPAHIAIVRPGPSVPPSLAFWSGEWAGLWNNNMDAVLVVEQVHPGVAKIVYAWGTSPNFGTTPGFEKGVARLTPTELTCKSPKGFVAHYTRQKDGTLAASWYMGQYSSYAKMVRVAAGKKN